MAEAAAEQRRNSTEGARRGSASLNRSMSSGQFQRSGQMTMNGTTTLATTGEAKTPFIPRYLSVGGLSKRKKLAKSTGNIHGYLAEDYHAVRCPLPKMFGEEKYGYSLIDITDPRYVADCAAMSKRLVRLSYDQQIIDLEWRKTYKALLDAEHRVATLGGNAPQKTKDLLKKDVENAMKYLLELQTQKDIYESEVKSIYEQCDQIKGLLKKEKDLEDLRMDMEAQTKKEITPDSPFWKTSFNIHSKDGPRTSGMGLEQ